MSGQVKRTFPVIAEGRGWPDYTKDVSRSIQHPGFYLQYGEQIQNWAYVGTDIESAFPHVNSPIEPGETVSLINTSTGLPMPYTLPEGYFWRCMQDFWSFSEIAAWFLYLDAPPFIPILQLVSEARYDTLGQNYYSEVVPLDTRDLDPTGTYAHQIDFRLKNIAKSELYGFWTHTCMISALSTPPFSKTKIVKCKDCGHLEEVPWDATGMECPQCGFITLYMIARHGGRMA